MSNTHWIAVGDWPTFFFWRCQSRECTAVRRFPVAASLQWWSCSSFATANIHRLFTLLCPVHTADTDATRLSCLLVCVGGVNWIGDKPRQFSVVLSISETEQFCLSSPAFGDRTKMQKKLNMFSLEIFCLRQSWLVSSSVHTADTDKTRQDSLVLSMSAVWRCELGITVAPPLYISFASYRKNLHLSSCR